MLDFDGLSDPSEFRRSADEFVVDPYPVTSTISAFISPLGRGVKIIVHVTPLPINAEEHHQAFAAAANAYSPLGTPDVGNDVTRLCFLSYDPMATLNPHTWGIRWKDSK